MNLIRGQGKLQTAYITPIRQAFLQREALGLAQNALYKMLGEWLVIGEHRCYTFNGMSWPNRLPLFTHISISP